MGNAGMIKICNERTQDLEDLNSREMFKIMFSGKRV